MTQRIVLLLTVLLLMIFQFGACEEASALLNAVDLSALEALEEEAGFDVLEWAKHILENGFVLDGMELSEVFREIGEEMRSDLQMTGKSIVVPVLCALFLKLLIKDGAMRRTALFICTVTCMTALVSVFATMLTVTQTLINAIVRCSNALTPVMVSMMTLTAAGTAASTLTPMSALAADFIQTLVQRVGLGLACACAGVAIAGNLSESVRLKRLHRLIRSAMHWGSGMVMTSFLGILSLQGRIVSGRDTAASRTAHYAVENLVPIIGGNISDSLDSLLAASYAVKNVIGVSGLLLLLSLCIVPLGRLIGATFSLKLISAVAEPLHDSALSDLAGQLSDAVEMLLLCAVTALVLIALLVGSCLTGARSIL